MFSVLDHQCSAWPELFRAIVASAELMKPSKLKSSRKFDAFAVWPDKLRATVASPEFTKPSPFASPTRKPTVSCTSFVFTPSLTFERVKVAYCAFVTELMFNVTVFVPLPVALSSDAAPKLFVALAISGADTPFKDDAKRFLESWEQRVPAECLP